SSARPGSWKGTRPSRRASTFSATTSRTTTSWPRSAKQAAVTRPTQPAPKIPSGSRSAISADNLLVERSQTLRDREHGLVRERIEQRVHHPVARPAGPQDDHVEVRAVVVEVVLAALDHLAEVLVRERGRVVPVALLDAPVLVRAVQEREAHRLRAVELVDTERHLGAEHGRPVEHRRDLEWETELPGGGLPDDGQHVGLA